MTNWWIVIGIPGDVASYLTHLPEASAVPSYRGMTRYTDDTIEVLESFEGAQQSYGVRICTDEESSVRSTYGGDYPCSIRHIEKGTARSTGGSVTELNTKYWNVYTADGTFQVHKTIHDETEGPVQWTVEMWGAVPDADTLIRVIRKYISQ